MPRETVTHGWSKEGKSLTACGLGWYYGRKKEGKKPLGMVKSFIRTGVTCKRCLKSKSLCTSDEV